MIDVAVGIVIKNKQVFLAKRSSKQHQGGLWEFPGGKREPEERPVDALIRELKEEVGITPLQTTFFESIVHDYGDKKVQLHFFLIESFDGTERGAEGQLTKWVPVSELNNYSFPKANVPIVAQLLETYSDR